MNKPGSFSELMINRGKSDIITEIKKLHGNPFYRMAIKDVLSILDTLEVKEVDLKKETTHYLLYEHCSPLNEIMHKADLKSEMQYHKDIENAFKAGFELRIKAQKGEGV